MGPQHYIYENNISYNSYTRNFQNESKVWPWKDSFLHNLKNYDHYPPHETCQVLSGVTQFPSLFHSQKVFSSASMLILLFLIQLQWRGATQVDWRTVNCRSPTKVQSTTVVWTAPATSTTQMNGQHAVSMGSSIEPSDTLVGGSGRLLCILKNLILFRGSPNCGEQIWILGRRTAAPCRTWRPFLIMAAIFLKNYFHSFLWDHFSSNLA